MRIVDHTVLHFGGDLAFKQGHERLEIEVSQGVYRWVQIPRQGRLVEVFRYMSDNDCLQHLVDLEPSYTTNQELIATITRKNKETEENAWRQGQAFVDIDPITGRTRIHFPGALAVPSPIWEASWSLRSRQHAVMIKLAMGGEI